MSRTITQADLQGRTLAELEALHHAVQQELAQTDVGSQARREALASLDALSRTIARRRALSGPRF